MRYCEKLDCDRHKLMLSNARISLKKFLLTPLKYRVRDVSVLCTKKLNFIELLGQRQSMLLHLN